MDDPDTFHGWSRRRLSYVSMNANAADLVDGEMVSTAEDVPHAPVDPDQPTEGEVVADDYQYDTVNPDASLRAAPLYPVPDVLFPVSVVMDNFDAYGEEDSDDDGPMEQAAPALHPLGGTDISNRSWYSPSKRRAGLGTMRRNELTSRTVNFTGLEMHRLGDLPEEMSSTNLLPENTSAGSSNSSVEFPEHNGDVSETSTLPSDACFVDHLLAVVERSTRELWRNKLELLLEMVVPLIFMIVSVILWVIWGTQFNEKMSYVSIDMGDRGVGAAGTGAPVIGDFTCMRQPDGTPQLSGFIRCQAMNISTCDNATGVCETHTIEPFTCDGDSSMLPLPSGYEICRVGFPWHEIITGSLSHYWRWLSAVPTLDTLISIQWTALAATRHILPYIVRTMVGLADNTRYSAILCSGALYFVGEYTATTQLMAYINKTSALFPYVTDFMVYGSVAEARKASQRGGRLWAIVELREISDAGLDVVLHMNNSALPSFTTTYDVAYGGGVLFDTAELYMLSGFNTLQQLVSEFYLNVFHKAVMNMTQMMASMATPEYDRVPLMTQAREILPLIFSMAFLYSVSKQTKRIVLEKELRIRESMLIMGLKQWTLYVSDFIVQLGIFVPTCVLCVVILKVTYITKSDPMILFLIFFLFALTTIPLSGMIATFFSKSRLASLVAPVVYFILVVPMFAMSNAQGPIVIWFSLFSPTGFAAALNVFLVHESGSGCGPPEMTSNRDNPTLAVLLIMMGVDFCVYCVLMLYLDNVMPKQWGTPKHPLFFIIDPVQWYRGSRTRVLEGGEDGRAENGVFEVTDYSKDSMSFQGLRKEYLRDGRKFTAVNNLYWGMREGEISVLLGHNGAGKTTVLNMVTGMVEPDEGDCYVYGMSVRTQLDKVRQQIGYCPQHNILWSELTCRDHLEFFGRIKGLRGWELEDAVCRMLHETDLLEKMDQPTKSLSGGQKRKLSVSIAFVTCSRLIFLDEPTAGMDVGARRYTWELLRRMSAHHTIFLTTHYMDEADLLGHKIGIMSHGRLKCSGSSLFLKSRLGTGYSITMSLREDASEGPISKLVESSVDGAHEVGVNGCEVMYRLPSERVEQFPEFLDRLEAAKDMLGIRGYSLSATTLEEIFLRLSNEDIEQQRNEDPFMQLDPEAMAAQERYIWNCEIVEGRKAMLWSQFKAMMWKRLWNGMRDRKMQFFQIVCPVICILIAMLLSLISLNGPDFILLNKEVYPAEALVDMNGCDDLLGPNASFDNFTVRRHNYMNALNLSVYMVDTFLFQPTLRVEGLVCRDPAWADSVKAPNNVIHILNSSTYHQGPISLNSIYQALYKKYTGEDARFKLVAGTMPRTKKEKVSQDALKTILMGAIIMIPFTFLPSNVVAWVVKERECKARHLQNVSGLSFYIYWITNFLFDIVAYIITMCLVIVIFLMFSREEYVAKDRIGAVLVLFFIYGLSSTTTGYMCSFFFDEHSNAQTIVMAVSFVSGFLLVMIVYIMSLLPQTMTAADTLKWISRIVPSFAIGEGIINLAMLTQRQVVVGDVTVWSAETIGWACVYMAIEFPLFFAVTLWIDHPRRRMWGQRSNYDVNADPQTVSDEDSDVEEVREKVYKEEAEGVNDDMVRVVDLRKVYANGKEAVRNVTFSVIPGEVFGFLGTNGAGKTTTISILCQEFLPTSGKAYVCGYDIIENSVEALQCIGYCPQFDATLDLLTVEEHLHLYVSVRGIRYEERDIVVDALLRMCELSMYRHTLSSELSGGNRRKLSVAMSLIGGPSVVFLDEPSAGMDPVARRGLWNAIKKVADNSSVVLTTHHLEEVEALAHRLAIMVDGSLRCIGDKTHLKTKFGTGFEMSIRVRADEDMAELHKWVKKKFPEATVNECKGRRFVYTLPATIVLSNVFRLLQRNKEVLRITDYSVSQTSIEQVFLKISGELEEATAFRYTLEDTLELSRK